MSPQIYTGAAIFDGVRLHRRHALLVAGGRVQGIVPAADAPQGRQIRLDGGTVSPGMVDLQVNGGGGIMLDSMATPERIAEICAAHARLGATGILPTLISDSAEATQAVIAAGIGAARAHTPGFLGLHLEGPHLDPRRAGAHDPAHLRPMTPTDLAMLCDAARALPALIVTLAPAAATPAQIAALAAAGAVVSLGHAEAAASEAEAAFRAGASMVTHLFNAMSQMGARSPGLVGATLATGGVAAGIIADGIHVADEALRVALKAKPRDLFLVSDAMAVAGTDAQAFTLGARRIERRDGRLTLQDGTLAGADLSLPQAVAHLRRLGVSAARALAMATSIPARLIGAEASAGHLIAGRQADFVHLGRDGALLQVWRGGAPLPLPPQLPRQD